MAKLWTPSGEVEVGVPPSAEVRRYDVTKYLEQLNSPFAVVSGGYGTTGRYGEPIETVESSFDGYVRQIYKRNGVVFAVILARLMLFTEARFQWRQVVFGDTGKLFGTAELDRLERPWPNGTTGELLARMEQDVSLAGNFYCVNEGDRLRRLRPDWVEIVLSAPPEEAVTSDVVGYSYTPGGYGRSEPQFYLPDEVCHWSPIPDPTAQYRGMAWLTPVIGEIESDQAATAHKNAFFTNGARPGLVVSLAESVTIEQFREFMTTMNASHQGVDNAYKTLYMGGGADVTVAGADLKQLDFRATQGAGETRICAAGGVPPIIVGLSEGLASATYSNYGMARRKFGDHWARPMWRSACAALQTILAVPSRAELWYVDSHIAFLREDEKDKAAILKEQMLAVESGVRAGFTAESVVSAVVSGDLSLMTHTGLFSVQLQPPGVGEAGDAAKQEAAAGLVGTQMQAISTGAQAGFAPDSVVEAVTEGDLSLLEPSNHPAPTAGEPVSAEAVAEPTETSRAGGDGESLKQYWTRGEGLAKWATHAHPWTTLYHHLLKYLPAERAKRTAAEWFHEVKGYWPGHQRGDNPVGPG